MDARKEYQEAEMELDAAAGLVDRAWQEYRAEIEAKGVFLKEKVLRTPKVQYDALVRAYYRLYDARHKLELLAEENNQ